MTFKKRIDRGIQARITSKFKHSPINRRAIVLFEISQQDSHQKLAEPRVDTKDPVDTATVDKLFDAL